MEMNVDIVERGLTSVLEGVAGKSTEKDVLLINKAAELLKRILDSAVVKDILPDSAVPDLSRWLEVVDLAADMPASEQRALYEQIKKDVDDPSYAGPLSIFMGMQSITHVQHALMGAYANKARQDETSNKLSELLRTLAKLESSPSEVPEAELKATNSRLKHFIKHCLAAPEKRDIERLANVCSIATGLSSSELNLATAELDTCAHELADCEDISASEAIRTGAFADACAHSLDDRLRRVSCVALDGLTKSAAQGLQGKAELGEDMWLAVRQHMENLDALKGLQKLVTSIQALGRDLAAGLNAGPDHAAVTKVISHFESMGADAAKLDGAVAERVQSVLGVLKVKHSVGSVAGNVLAALTADGNRHIADIMSSIGAADLAVDFEKCAAATQALNGMEHTYRQVARCVAEQSEDGEHGYSSTAAFLDMAVSAAAALGTKALQDNVNEVHGLDAKKKVSKAQASALFDAGLVDVKSACSRINDAGADALAAQFPAVDEAVRTRFSKWTSAMCAKINKVAERLVSEAGAGLSPHVDPVVKALEGKEDLDCYKFLEAFDKNALKELTPLHEKLRAPLKHAVFILESLGVQAAEYPDCVGHPVRITRLSCVASFPCVLLAEKQEPEINGSRVWAVLAQQTWERIAFALKGLTWALDATDFR